MDRGLIPSPARASRIRVGASPANSRRGRILAVCLSAATLMFVGSTSPISTVTGPAGAAVATVSHSAQPRLASWSSQSVPYPMWNNGYLAGVACPSATLCVAVGGYTNPTGQSLALVQTWNGAKWTMSNTPAVAGATGASLSSVSCTSVTSCVAVGTWTNKYGFQNTLAESWAGTTWKVMTTVNVHLAQSSVLNSVKCVSSGSCVAVGASSQQIGSNSVGLIERLIGSAWSIVASPKLSGATDTSLSAVSCSSSSACTAVGFYMKRDGVQWSLVERLVGTAWTILMFPEPAGATNSYLDAVVCAGSVACIAAGTYSLSDGTNRGLVDEWSGSTWTPQATPSLPAGKSMMISSLACVTISTCTAAGVTFPSGGSASAMAMGLSGTTWTQQTMAVPPMMESTLNAISCVSSACIAVGGFRDANLGEGPVAENFGGGTWKITVAVSPYGAHGSTLLGVSCTSTSACTGVGYVTRPFGPPKTFAERWNGSKWVIQVSAEQPGFNNLLAGVSCPTSAWCAAVGNSFQPSLAQPLIEIWNGANWTLRVAPIPFASTASVLSSVSCTSATACVAVGNYQNGTNHHVAFTEIWNGLSWSVTSFPPVSGSIDSVLTAVSCHGAHACTAVGYFTTTTQSQYGLAGRWNGATWAIQKVPEPAGNPDVTLTGVSCSTSTDCVAVGPATSSVSAGQSIVDHWNGSLWKVATSVQHPVGAIGSRLNSVACTSPTACTAVGAGIMWNNGALLAMAGLWNGHFWAFETVPHPGPASALVGVTCPTASVCVGVGEEFNTGTNLPVVVRN